MLILFLLLLRTSLEGFPGLIWEIISNQAAKENLSKTFHVITVSNVEKGNPPGKKKPGK